MSLISTSKLCKSYNGKVLFNNLSFSIENGDKAVFVGDSGTGKTTLLRMLLGIVTADCGSISYGNQELSRMSVDKIRKQVAYLPQGVDLFANTGEELLYLLGLDFSSVSQNMVRLLLSESAIKQQFAELSGGEKQRLVTAIVLGLNRPIIFLDEPTSALDANAVNALMSLISDNPELTVVSTSHNPLWVEFCNKKITL